MKVAIKEYFPSGFCERSEDGITVLPLIGDLGKNYKEGLNKVIEEARRLAKMNKYSSVVEVYDCIECNRTFYIVMEYLEGETLGKILKRVKKISAKESIGLILPVMKALQKIHEAGMIHRDIAPDNIFVTNEGRVVLLDLGSARYVSNLIDKSNEKSKLPVKDGFSAIEQYIYTDKQGSYTDVYALGATLYTMMTGRKLDTSLIRKARGKGDVVDPIAKYCSDIDDVLNKAIMKAIEIDIDNRTKDIKSFMKDLLKSNVMSDNVMFDEYNKYEHIKKLFKDTNNLMYEETIDETDEDDDVATVYADAENKTEYLSNSDLDNIYEDVRQTNQDDNKDTSGVYENSYENEQVEEIEVIEEMKSDYEEVEEIETNTNNNDLYNVNSSNEAQEQFDVYETDEKIAVSHYTSQINSEAVINNEVTEEKNNIQADNKQSNKRQASINSDTSTNTTTNNKKSSYTSRVSVHLDSNGVERWIPQWVDDKKDYVYFGTYPQNLLPANMINNEITSAYYGVNRTSNVRRKRYKRVSEQDVEVVKADLWSDGDYKFFMYEPIKWRVLKNEDGILTLISDKILDCKKYHNDRKEVGYGNSSLKGWLNDNFLKFAFDRIEVRYIEEVNGEKVSLLSLDEAKEYFENDTDRIASPTQYAMYEGIWIDPKNNTSWWWLKNDKKAISATVNSAFEGYKDGVGVSVVNKADGVRVIIRVRIDE